MSAKARPTSARSTTAWGDYGNARPDSQFDFGQDGIRDEADLTPTAMEDDSVYVSGNKNKSSAVATSSKNESKSCLAKIGGGIRSLWATRQTEDVKGDRELHVKTTLRELIIYIVFLVILCIVTFGMTQTTMYYYTKVMSDLFLDKTTTGGGSFRTITSVEDFWKFAKDPLINGLYWETWYNNKSVPDEQLGYIYYENKLLGVPRLRQLQVHSNSCVVHSDFKDSIRECYESYAESLENKQPYGKKDNYTAWYYRTQDELDGSSHWGKIATYSGAGYVQDLTRNKSESADIINYLFDERWIRRGTRVLFIDFTVYNANINLFCVIRLTVEFPPTGGAIPHATMRTVKLIRYVTVMDYFIMACEFILCLFIFYYMIEEAIEIKKHKFSYFKSVWNILDILVIIIALVCVAFNVYRTIKVDELLQELLDKPDQYADFEFLSYGQTQFDNAIAIAVFLAWIKIFKYISFNKTMTQLSSTLGKCAKDLAGFAVMFFIIFLAFTQLGYLLFGTQVKDFSNFANSFFTLFRIILGDFDFDQLEAANRVLGPIFFMLFVFFVFFVLINMFLAIINDTYSEVKGDMANQKNEFEMGDYFKRGYEKMLSKLNFKHDKIVDIQKALKSADINDDKQVDFDEWRQDLKTRGYADPEIEALFAKYDTDGDRVLDEEEQKRMQADLNDQKAALSKEYDELDKIDRPESARRSTSRVSFNDDSADDSDDEDSHTKSSRSGPSQSVSYEEFTVLSRRVDRMEHSIGSIVSKIDAVLVKLEAMEKAKLKRRETMGKILDSITESDGTSDEVKREQMERLVREELERWDSESSITPQPSQGRGPSPSSSGHGGARSRSRPASGGNAAPLPDGVVGQELMAETNMPETPLIGEIPLPDDSRLDQTEQHVLGYAQCESAEAQGNSAGSLGRVVPDLAYHNFSEDVTQSLQNLNPNSLPPSPLMPSAQGKKFPAETCDGNRSEPLNQAEKKDIRPTTPILPGIPSSSYSSSENVTDLQLSLLKPSSGNDSKSCIPNTRESDSKSCIPNTRESDSKSCIPNTRESDSKSCIPITSLSTPSSDSSDLSGNSNEKLSSPLSKSANRNEDSIEKLSRPSSKRSDRNEGSNAKLSEPSTKSLDRNEDFNEKLSRPSSECTGRNKHSEEDLPRPTSKSSDRNEVSNEKFPRPSSKSSDRSRDSNKKLPRPSSKSSDRSEDSNKTLSSPSSKSSDRSEDSNKKLPRPLSESSARSDNSKARLSRPTSKSSDRNNDAKASVPRPLSKSSDMSDNSKVELSCPVSKRADMTADSKAKLSRPSSKSSDRSEDLNEKFPKSSSKSLDRSNISVARLSSPSSESRDRSEDSDRRLTKPRSKSSDRNKEPNARSTRLSSESPDRIDEKKSNLLIPTVDIAEISHNMKENCDPSSKRLDRNKDSKHEPTPKSSSRDDNLKLNLSQPPSESLNRDSDPRLDKHIERPSVKGSGKGYGKLVRPPSKSSSSFSLLSNESESNSDSETMSDTSLSSSSLNSFSSKNDPDLDMEHTSLRQVAENTDQSSNMKPSSELGSFGLLPKNSDSKNVSALGLSSASNANEINMVKGVPDGLRSKENGQTMLSRSREIVPSDFSVINEKKQQVDKELSADTSNDISVQESLEVSPKVITTAKGQKVTMGTLSKMAKLAAKPGSNVNSLTNKTDAPTGIQTRVKYRNSSPKTKQSGELPTEVQNQAKGHITAGGVQVYTLKLQHNKRDLSKSPERSANAVLSSNLPSCEKSEVANGENESVTKPKGKVDGQKESVSVNLLPLSSKILKQKAKKPRHSNQGIGTDDNDISQVSESQRSSRAKRPAPPRPTQGSSTDSVNAQGKGCHASESKKHEDCVIFV